MGMLMDYVKEKAKEKEKTPIEWLQNIATKASQCRIGTHMGKFVHPNANVLLQDMLPEADVKGYVTTSSVNCDIDISTNAAYLGTAKFLLLELDDGISVYEHMKKDPSFLAKELSDLDIDFVALQQSFLSADDASVPTATDERLRQVYFPLENKDYHLLTVLPPSSVAIELRKRIRDMEFHAKQVRKNEIPDTSYETVFDLTEIAYGGTKPQNISTQNSNNGGRNYLMPSLPPLWKELKVVIPKEEFFVNTVYTKDYKELFQELHKTYKRYKNNMEIRATARKQECCIIDSVLIKAYALQEKAPGWSHNTNLDKAECIWLDGEYAQERQQNQDWQEEIAEKFAKWFVDNYKKINGRNSVELGDAEIKEIKYEILTALRY